MEDRMTGSMELSKSRVVPTNVVTCEQFNRPPNIFSNRSEFLADE